MLLTKLAEYLKTRPKDSFFQVVREAAVGEEDSTLIASEPKVEDAETVEAGGMRAHVVKAKAASQFTHFLDGIERAHMPLRGGIFPMLYGFTGAVIRGRDTDRHMFTFDVVSGEKLYFPFACIDPSALIEIGIAAKDVAEEGDRAVAPSEMHPLRLLDLERAAVRRDREEAERKLAERWMKHADGWLLWDGSITGGFETYKHLRIVGVIKSHRTQYFTGEEQRTVLELRAGERSSVFMPKWPGRTPVYSWYLRLHPNEGRDVYFGLIRVEAAAANETIAMADEISCWLLAERSPLSLPDGRWDKLLYPIRDCEQYLRSIAPSRVMIESALAGR